MSRRQRYVDLKETFLPDLNLELDQIQSDVDRIPKQQIIVAATINDTETEIPHLLGSPPADIRVVPVADVRWWKTQNSTSRSIFLAASAEVKADIILTIYPRG